MSSQNEKAASGADANEIATNEIARKMWEALFYGAISNTSAESFQAKLWELLSDDDRRAVAKMYLEYLERSLRQDGKHSSFAAEEILAKRVRALIDDSIRALVAGAVKAARDSGELDAILAREVASAVADSASIRKKVTAAVGTIEYDSEFRLDDHLAKLVRTLIHSALARAARELGSNP